MKVAGFIPARYAATRLPGKPLADICGRPMVQWVYEGAKRSALLDSVAIATDDERVASVARSFGAGVVMTSDKHLSGTDRVAEAASSTDAGIIVNIQGDEPLIKPGMIDAAIRPMLDDPSIVMASVMTRMTDEAEFLSPHAVKVVVDKDGFALYFTRSPIPFDKRPFGTRPNPVYKHIGLYVYNRDFLMRFARMPLTPLAEAESLEQLKAMENGFRIKLSETDSNPISVDTPEDLDTVRRLVALELNK